MGSRVLAKQKNNMWHRSVILKLPENDGDEYRVKFEASGKIVEVGLQDLLPLGKHLSKINYLIYRIVYYKIFISIGDADLELSDTSDDSDDEESDTNLPSYSNEQLLHKSLLTPQPNEPLGNWERHTRGIGSKIMMQMGYVVGTGLGKRSDGRIEPVKTTVLPAGKSLGLFHNQFFFSIITT